MENEVFELEFELKSSAKLIFPFLSTVADLEKWFADEVKILDKKKINFIWEDEDHIATLDIKKQNTRVEINFEPVENNNKIVFELEENDFTNTIFLKVYDSSGIADNYEECQEIWATLIDELKNNIGA